MADLVLINFGVKVKRSCILGVELRENGWVRFYYDIKGHEIPGFEFQETYSALRWFRGRFPDLPLVRVFPDGKRVTSTPECPFRRGNHG